MRVCFLHFVLSGLQIKVIKNLLYITVHYNCFYRFRNFFP